MFLYLLVGAKYHIFILQNEKFGSGSSISSLRGQNQSCGQSQICHAYLITTYAPEAERTGS